MYRYARSVAGAQNLNDIDRYTNKYGCGNIIKYDFKSRFGPGMEEKSNELLYQQRVNYHKKQNLGPEMISVRKSKCKSTKAFCWVDRK